MAVLHEGVFLKNMFTNLIPNVLILDFFEAHYWDDSEDDLYEARCCDGRITSNSVNSPSSSMKWRSTLTASTRSWVSYNRPWT